MTTPATPASDVEEIFFLEGVDGRADSLPSSHDLGPPSPSPAEQPDESPAKEEVVEDPARARRRRAARVGVAWGAVAMLVFAGAAQLLGSHTHERSARVSASPPRVEVVAGAVDMPVVAAPPSETPPSLPAPVVSARDAVHATAPSVVAVASARRAVTRRGSHPSLPARAASTSPKTSPRTAPARVPSVGAASKKPKGKPAPTRKPGAVPAQA